MKFVIVALLFAAIAVNGKALSGSDSETADKTGSLFESAPEQLKNLLGSSGGLGDALKLAQGSSSTDGTGSGSGPASGLSGLPGLGKGANSTGGNPISALTGSGSGLSGLTQGPSPTDAVTDTVGGSN
ncbi:GPI-anchored CFEM domain protein A-like [Contarinia nasturtii]|uniref:GPI-anchored CFEM domain protein A-like n=1 Tax=Contarinia nasturtii TaxID=265458 RepID=UPI0012D46167|nr:GPI-anchored CFEM domain protein A-like [Contarinia nasturtii]